MIVVCLGTSFTQSSDFHNYFSCILCLERAKKEEGIDALTLLIQDHANLKRLYEQYQTAGSDLAQKKTLSNQIIKEICIHSGIEESVLYPAMRHKLQPDGAKLADTAIQEHQKIERMLSELQHIKLKERTTDYDTKLAEIMQVMW